MSDWSSTKSKCVLRALFRIGWKIKRQHGSHVVLGRPMWNDYIWAFHDNEEIGQRMLSRIAKKTGLSSKDV